MRQSELFTKTKKEAPKDATTISHKLLIRADFIDQHMSGVYSFLPLGWRVHRKIADIIREEISAIGGQEVSLPTLQSKNIWTETGRWHTIDPPLFKLTDRHGKELAIASTHEEIITKLVCGRISSYTELPFSLFQIHDKFRNELRAQGGLLRVREFVMKDLYSFHASEKDLALYYEKVILAYKKIFKRCGLKPVIVQAHGGSIGGAQTNEFMIVTESGEDKIVVCKSCDWGANIELFDKKNALCPECKKTLTVETSVEAAHIFNLGDKYTKALKATYTTKEGKQKNIVMGCYGIGLGRLMATAIEVHNDKDGMIWPEEIAPYDVHLLVLGNNKKVRSVADTLYEDLSSVASGVGGQKAKIEVLYDDRDISAGEKFNDTDLIGIPWRVVVSEKTVEKKSVEIKKRDKREAKIIKIRDITKMFERPE